MSTNPQTGPSEYSENIQNSIHAMQYMETTLMQQAEQKLQEDIAILETLPAQLAYSFSLAVLGQATQLLGLAEVGQPSEQLNTEDATLNMCTYIQSLWNDLSGSASGYVPGQSTPTSTQADEGTDLYESLTDLQSLLTQAVTPGSKDYGWMNEQTADTMLNSVDSLLNSITDDGQDTSGSAIANNILTWYSSYDSNPSESPYSTQINDCTNDMNTMINTMNQASSVTTGLMKTGVSELQQYFGAIESSGQSQQQELNYCVQNEIPS